MKFVIHELLKQVNEAVTPRYRDALIDPTQEETAFVTEVEKLFKRHQSGRIYGTFEENVDTFPFSKILLEWRHDQDFLKFSKRGAAFLAEKMGRSNFATGGYFFAASVEADEEKYLLLFMLSQHLSHAVDVETLSLQRSLSLKTEQLDLAARICLSDLDSGRPEPVSLIRGRKEVSDYFKEFIGLHQPRTNTDGTKKLKDFVDSWMENKNFTPQAKTDVRSRLLAYSKERGDDPVELSTVSALVDPQNHEIFFAEANAQGLGAEFHIDRRCLKAWERVKFDDGTVKVNFARSVLNDRVIYNGDEHTLLIRNVKLAEEDLR